MGRERTDGAEEDDNGCVISCDFPLFFSTKTSANFLLFFFCVFSRFLFFVTDLSSFFAADFSFLHVASMVAFIGEFGLTRWLTGRRHGGCDRRRGGSCWWAVGGEGWSACMQGKAAAGKAWRACCAPLRRQRCTLVLQFMILSIVSSIGFKVYAIMPL